MKTYIQLISVGFLSAFILSGCAVGRTGKMGTPIATRYQAQLNNLKIGVSTPDDLKKSFETIKVPVSLEETKMEDNKKVEIWQVARGGNMDAADLLLWGVVSYDKDQEILFRFEDDKLVSFQSVVLPDPVSPPPPTPVTSPKQSSH